MLLVQRILSLKEFMTVSNRVPQVDEMAGMAWCVVTKQPFVKLTFLIT